MAQSLDEEASCKSLQRRVQRRFLEKLQLDPPSIIKCNTAEEAAVRVKEISGLTSDLDTRGSSSSSNNNNSNDAIALPINMAGSIHTQATATATTLPLKCRRTTKQAHSDMAKKKHQKVLADRAYLAATKTIMDENNNNKQNVSGKTSVTSIVAQVNSLYNTDLNAKTA